MNSGCSDLGLVLAAGIAIDYLILSICVAAACN